MASRYADGGHCERPRFQSGGSVALKIAQERGWRDRPGGPELFKHSASIAGGLRQPRPRGHVKVVQYDRNPL